MRGEAGGQDAFAIRPNQDLFVAALERRIGVTDTRQGAQPGHRPSGEDFEDLGLVPPELDLAARTGSRSPAHRTGQREGDPGVGRQEAFDPVSNLSGVDRALFLVDEIDIEAVVPLYSMEDAEDALESFEGYPYRRTATIGKDATCTFYEAGHILGSALSMIKVRNNGRWYTVCYTGDIGRFNKPIIKDPALHFEATDQDIDFMVMESTYGNRFHDPIKDLKQGLKTILNETIERGGSIIIPAFAYGRTQELLYVLHELYNDKEVSRIPVFVDSPLATNITRVFGEHPEVYDLETHETFLQKGHNPFYFDQVHFVGSVEESMALNREEKPHIVISASGMCEAGRVLHHLRHKIHNRRHTILIVGYMAQNTLGRRILEQGLAYEEAGRKGPPPMLKFLNKIYPLKARVRQLGGFSAHGDRDEMVRFLKTSNLRIKNIAVVLGEEDQSIAFAQHLQSEGFSAFVPNPGDTIRID